MGLIYKGTNEEQQSYYKKQRQFTYLTIAKGRRKSQAKWSVLLHSNLAIRISAWHPNLKSGEEIKQRKKTSKGKAETE